MLYRRMKLQKFEIGRRRIVLVLLLLLIFMVRLVPHLGEWYAVTVYPWLSAALSWSSAVVPFSFDEWIVIGAVVFMAAYPVYAYKKGRKGTHILSSTKKWKHSLAVNAEVLGWIVVWFYLGWGMNYFRDSFFERAGVEPSKVEKREFKAFLQSYTDSLNATYTHLNKVDEEIVRHEIKDIYSHVVARYGLCKPHDYQQPKVVAFNELYSSVGVLGYMGPFADESHLNMQLFPVQYPFTYAHELAHLLSVSSEAEANFWAYTVCTSSKDRRIRYSGYFGLLPNVARNAEDVLTEEEYKTWLKSIDPRIIAEHKVLREFWQQQYSPFLAEIQHQLFNALLKGNRISNGTKNYDQVLEIIISMKGMPTSSGTVLGRLH